MVQFEQNMEPAKKAEFLKNINYFASPQMPKGL
jgi:hypothetical protein